MSVWFEGAGSIDCALEDVAKALEQPGDYHAGVVRLMPGMTSVELIEQGPNSVAITTNEGLMTRSNIATLVEPDRVVVEFDERYEAGSKVTATTHFLSEFTAGPGGLEHRIVLSDVDAPGFLGFFYEKFGSSKIGKAFLSAHKSYLENASR